MKKQTANTKQEIIGWIGVILVISSYFLLTFGVVDGETPIYHILILMGALFVGTISYTKRAFQPFILNAIFALLALIALLRIYFA